MLQDLCQFHPLVFIQIPRPLTDDGACGSGPDPMQPARVQRMSVTMPVNRRPGVLSDSGVTRCPESSSVAVTFMDANALSSTASLGNRTTVSPDDGEPVMRADQPLSPAVP